MGEVYTINGVYTPRMTTREALLKAVLAAPDDDLPRLVFADHLEGELGEPERAEFIRREINRARLDREILCHQPEAKMGDWCNDSLCPKCGQQIPWTYLPCPPEDLFGNDDSLAILDRTQSVVWERGFVHKVGCTLADWLAHGPAVVREHPVTKVVLTDREPFEQTSGGWVWVKQFVNMERHMLTPEVFDTGHVSRRWPGGTTSVTFATSDEATVAASAALIQWAKSQPV